MCLVFLYSSARTDLFTFLICNGKRSFQCLQYAPKGGLARAVAVVIQEPSLVLTLDNMLSCWALRVHSLQAGSARGRGRLICRRIWWCGLAPRNFLAQPIIIGPAHIRAIPDPHKLLLLLSLQDKRFPRTPREARFSSHMIPPYRSRKTGIR